MREILSPLDGYGSPFLSRAAGVGDTTPPEIIGLSFTDSVATATVTEAGTVWWLISSSGTEMGGGDVKAAVLAGTPDLYGSFAVTVGETDEVIDTSSLAVGTWYLHAEAQDAGGNISIAPEVASFDIAAAGWDLATAAYASKSFSVTSQDTSPAGIYIKPDGLKLYMVGGTTDDVFEYNLGTAWDISTASYVQTFNSSPDDNQATGIYFKDDGSIMYLVGNNGNEINQYALGTAWNISTASLTSTLSIGAQESGPSGVYFRSDGLRMYTVGIGGDSVDEYTLGTAWDTATATYSREKAVGTQDADSHDLSFSTDGTKFFTVGSVGDAVYQYDLATAWDVTSATYSKSFSVASQSGEARGLFFKGDGLAFYVADSTTATIYQYGIS